MAIRISTGAADHIREVCTHNGVLDTVQQAEMRMESQGYRDEVMGRHDEEFDPNDDDGRSDGPEDFGPQDDGDGWDDDEPTDMTDVEADADALAGAGYGTDEDYGGAEDFGFFGDCSGE